MFHTQSQNACGVKRKRALAGWPAWSERRPIWFHSGQGASGRQPVHVSLSLSPPLPLSKKEEKEPYPPMRAETTLSEKEDMQ